VLAKRVSSNEWASENTCKTIVVLKLNGGNNQPIWLKNPPKSSKTKTLLLMVLPNFDQSASADSRYWTITFCSYPKVAISKRFTVNQAETLIEAQSLI
jgi:hypothetical protein